MKTIAGVLIMERAPSSTCRRGAFYSARYQARHEGGGWAVIETGKAGCAIFPTVGQALQIMSELERIADAREQSGTIKNKQRYPAKNRKTK